MGNIEPPETGEQSSTIAPDAISESEDTFAAHQVVTQQRLSIVSMVSEQDMTAPQQVPAQSAPAEEPET